MRYIEPPRRNIFSYVLPFLIIIGLGVCAFFGFREYLMANILLKIAPLPSQVQVSLIYGESASVVRFHSGERESLNLLTLLNQGDIVSTRQGTFVEMKIFDGSTLRLRENSAVAFSRLENSSNASHVSIDVLEGEIYMDTVPQRSEKSDFLVITPKTVSRLSDDAVIVSLAQHERIQVLSGSVFSRLIQKLPLNKAPVSDIVIPGGFEIFLDAETFKAVIEGQRLIPRRIPGNISTPWYMFSVYPEILPVVTR